MKFYKQKRNNKRRNLKSTEEKKGIMKRPEIRVVQTVFFFVSFQKSNLVIETKIITPAEVQDNDT